MDYSVYFRKTKSYQSKVETDTNATEIAHDQKLPLSIAFSLYARNSNGWLSTVGTLFYIFLYLDLNTQEIKRARVFFGIKLIRRRKT